MSEGGIRINTRYIKSLMFFACRSGHVPVTKCFYLDRNSPNLLVLFVRELCFEQSRHFERHLIYDAEVFQVETFIFAIKIASISRENDRLNCVANMSF